MIKLTKNETLADVNNSSLDNSSLHQCTIRCLCGLYKCFDIYIKIWYVNMIRLLLKLF